MLLNKKETKTVLTKHFVMKSCKNKHISVKKKKEKKRKGENEKKNTNKNM